MLKPCLPYFPICTSLPCACLFPYDYHTTPHAPRRPKEWEHTPLISPKAATRHVGLKNACATCYMNAVLQQLYMLPSVRNAILSVDGLPEDAKPTSLLHAMQILFAQLRHSNMQYVMPEHVWKTYRHQGQAVNLREQWDAFECWSQMVDQLDEGMKLIQRPKAVGAAFEGVFAVQKIIKVCRLSLHITNVCM